MTQAEQDEISRKLVLSAMRQLIAQPEVAKVTVTVTYLDDSAREYNAGLDETELAAKVTEALGA